MLRRTRFCSHPVVAVVIGALLLIPSVVFADADEDHSNFVMHALWGLLYHQKDLDLSEDQVSKITSLKLTYAKTHIKGEAEVKLAKVEALGLKMNEKAEMGAIEAPLQKLERAKTELHLEGVQSHAFRDGHLNTSTAAAMEIAVDEVGQKAS